jgi:hypothetical protein
VRDVELAWLWLRWQPDSILSAPLCQKDKRIFLMIVEEQEAGFRLCFANHRLSHLVFAP